MDPSTHIFKCKSAQAANLTRDQSVSATLARKRCSEALWHNSQLCINGMQGVADNVISTAHALIRSYDTHYTCTCTECPMTPDRRDVCSGRHV